MAARFRGSFHGWVRLSLFSASAAALIAGFGCSSDDASGKKTTTGTNGQCLSNRTYFAQKVWAPVMSKICIKCHSPDGVATEENAKLLLLPESYPGFLDANLANVEELAKTQYDGMSVLLRKPLGEMDHGGGVQIQKGTPEYEALEAFVQKLSSSEVCTGGDQTMSFDDVAQLDALGTFRKAALQLNGRLPNAKEVETIVGGGEGALPAAIDGLFQEDAFYARLKEMFNDLLLTDRYLGYSSYAANLLNKTQYPNAGDAWFNNLPSDQKTQVNQALAREPLDLIAYVVRNDRPMTEILTAKYTVMNPYTAKIYNAKVQFSNPNDPNELHEGQIIALGDTTKGEPAEMPLPQAGILTSPIWMNRFPSSPTNRNRHRARMIFKFFLATDILKIAERPIDPTAATAYANPTREDSACNVCHRMIDPIAGAFQKFDDNDQEKYEPNNNWHQEMFPPGFGKEVMQTTDYADALGWLAQRIVDDPRFSLAMVYTMYTAITGQEPLVYPTDPAEPDYNSALDAWSAQDAMFRAIGDQFVKDNYNLKTVIRAVVLSPYFRARNAKTELSASREVALSNVGTGRLSTPEVLGRKVTAVTGLPWGKGVGYYKTDYLSSDYKVLYGGIDSDDVTVRLTSPNGVMANIVWRMADEVSCQSTAWDLSIDDKSKRFLFPYVDITDTPDTSEQAIKKNIQYLHGHILGEALALDDPELLRTYQLFKDTVNEGKAAITAGTLTDSLVTSCRARKDPYTDADLPADQKIEKDPDYTVRGWMAVITYLLSDYSFLYE
jgi:hypothetical protein